jgi:Putative adhesin
MRSRVRVIPALLIFMMAAVAAMPAFAQQDGHFDRTLSVTGAVDLSVQTGSGNITVRPGDASKVEVHGVIHANHSWMGGDVAARIHDIETNPPIQQNGNTIRIGHFDDREREHNISISYEVIVPAQTKLHSESGSGDESIDGIAGPIETTSGSGELKVSNIGGEVHARTGSGGVELNSIKGNARVSSGSGTIRAIGIAGGLNASSGSGEVKLEQTAAGDIDISTGSGDVEIKGAKGAVHVSTGSGEINAQGVPTGDWKLRTGSGSVTVNFPPEAAFDLYARSSSGNIETKHEISVEGTMSQRELRGKVKGGGVRVELSTSSGSINIL